MVKQIVLIVLQSLCILFLLLTGPIFVPVIIFLLVQILGILMIIWSLLTIWQNRKQSYKLPRGYSFITTGPYEIIRHPIAAGLFFLIFPLVQADLTLLRMLIFILFIILTLLKISFDESLMRQAVKEYADYQTKTRRLIPYFY